MLRTIVIATITALSPLPALAAAPTTLAAAPTTIMVAGDSISHGSAGDYTWRYRLWRHLTGNAVTVDFVGPNNRLYDNVRSSGATIVESDAYADPAFDRDHNARSGRFVGTYSGYPVGAKDTIRADVQAYRPQYLIALLGTNDLFWFSTLDPVVVAQHMATFIDNARAARADIRIVLVAVPPTKAGQDDAILAGRVATYNQQLAGLATSRSTATSPIAYVPPPADYQPDYLQSIHDSHDGTHPNARGEIRIADGIADVLSARFGLGPAYPLSFAGVNTGPVLPFILRCLPGDGTATLTWDESPGSTGYWIQRRFAGAAWEPSVYQLTMNDQPYVNIWLYNGVPYEYRLQAAKMYDPGVFSNTCVVTPTAT